MRRRAAERVTATTFGRHERRDPRWEREPRRKALCNISEGISDAPLFLRRWLLAAILLGSTADAADQALDTKRIESITGLTGTYNQAENVFKVSKPRTDIQPSVDRWTLPPFMGITSYAAFTPMGTGRW